MSVKLSERTEKGPDALNLHCGNVNRKKMEELQKLGMQRSKQENSGWTWYLQLRGTEPKKEAHVPIFRGMFALLKERPDTTHTLVRRPTRATARDHSGREPISSLFCG